MRKLILTKKASKSLYKLLIYLELEWSVNVKNDFVLKLDESLKQVQKFPRSSKKTIKVNDLHMAVVTKQTSFFYYFNSKSVTVVSLFDTRMNPKKIKKGMN